MNKRIVKSIIPAFTVACIIWLGIIVYNAVVLLGGNWTGLSIASITPTPRKLLLLAGIFAVMVAFFWDRVRFSEYVFRYRYAIASVLFVLCIAVGITGSSIGLYCNYFGTEETGVLLGVSRAIRSDEWAVSTPMAWSQYYGEEPFSYFSTIVRGTKTDVFLEYGQAVADWMIIFRPFYIGYLFLPIANGMAFFWCGRFLALFMVSFEFGRLLTKDKRVLSLAYAFLIAFSPVVQWWFAINGLVEMLIYIQLSIIVLREFMLTTSYLKRLGLVFAAVICAGGYVLTFYPAWQVPFAYVLLALIIWTILEYRDRCTMRVRDWLAIGGGVILLALAIAVILYKSMDTIEALLNTAYPGKRSSTGGGQLDYLFNYVFSIWMTLSGNSPVANTCECAYFIDLFPLCHVVAAVVLLKQKRKDKLLLCVLAVGLVLGIFCIFGFPEFLAKITLLSYSQSGRAMVAFGFCNVLLLVRGIMLLREIHISHPIMASCLALGLALLLAVNGGYKLNPEWFSVPEIAGMVVLFGALFGCGILVDRKYCFRVWTLMMMGVSLLAGGLVNPVRVGVSDVEQISELKAVKNVAAAEEDALWVVDGMGLPMNNALLLKGVPTLNSTNVYPNMELWMSLDGGKNADIYNRYAHITVNIIEQGEVSYEIPSLDEFVVNLTLEDLKTLNVKYIFTGKELTGEVTLIEKVNNYHIYQLN